MNYKKIYDSIINNAIIEKRKKKNGTYYEKHHILPKSIGGTNDLDNLVLLTFKEHYVCHKLLYVIYKDTEHNKKMMYAFYRMNLKGNSSLAIKGGRYYEEVRAEFCNSQSEKARLNVGRIVSYETRLKQSISRKGMKLPDEWRFNIKKSITDEMKEKSRDRMLKTIKKGKLNNLESIKEKWKTKEYRDNISIKIKESYKNNPKLKENVSKTIKKFRNNNPDFKPNSKKIFHISGIIFTSVKEASIHSGISYQTFVWRLKNNKLTDYSLVEFKHTIESFNL